MTSDKHEHYFTAAPSVPFKRETVTAEIWGHELRFATGSGVFSHSGLDKATAVLFRETVPPTSGHILDLGCGWGAIGCGIAVASPQAQVTMVDVNERAILLANENAESLGVASRAKAFTADIVEGHYDEIWSNPPIRIGKTALHELLLTWLPRLVPGGTATMVVGKNLGADSLQAWLIDQGYPTERLASAKGFRVLRLDRLR